MKSRVSTALPLAAIAGLALITTSTQAAVVLDTDTGGTEWLITTSEGSGSETYQGNLVTSTIDRNGLGDGNTGAPWSRHVKGGNAYGFIQYRADGAGDGAAATATGTWTISNLAAGQYDIATAFDPHGSGSAIRYTVNGAETFVDQSTIPAAAAGPTFSGNYNGSRTNDIFFTTIGTSLTVAEGGTITVTVDNSDNAAAQRTIMDSVAITVVPEPSSTALLGLGGLAVALWRRRK